MVAVMASPIIIGYLNGGRTVVELTTYAISAYHH
jgi:hypothetical protein